MRPGDRGENVDLKAWSAQEQIGDLRALGRGENGDLRVRSAEEQIADLRALCARAIKDRENGDLRV